MKNLLPILLLFLNISVFAQFPCDQPQSFVDMQGNNIRARIPNDGRLFTHPFGGHFRYNPGPDGTGPSSVFSAGLWIGGLDTSGTLKLAAVTYYNYGRNDFFAGPLSPEGTTTNTDCSNWDRHFVVKADEIIDFLNDLPTLSGDSGLAIASYPNIMGWPGRGNPYFSAINGYSLPGQDLAGFWDANQDGIYNALNGDYPAVVLQNSIPFVPTVQVWSVFNDKGAEIEHPAYPHKPNSVEVQQTAWAFDCTDKPILENTVFTSHKIISRSTERLDSFFVGIWVDFDIGCADDDFLGTNPGVGFFAYNQDALDGNVGGACFDVPTFGDHPPVQSVTFLNKKMNKAMIYNDYIPPYSINDPISPFNYYNYLTGTFLDGTAPTTGGNGYNLGSGLAPVDYMFPGDPADPNGWSMCTASLPVDNRRALGSTKIGSMLPGAVEELTLAWTVHPNPPLPCGLGTMYDDVNWLKDFYTNGFPGLCSSAAKAPEPAPDTLELFPNPAMNQFTLTYGNMKISELRLYAADGRWVRTLKNLPSEKVIVPVHDLTTGMYEMQLITDQGNFIRKLSIAR
jgi:hypothetical protein